ncbi:hypothetical protein MLD38_025450 [Melastoma candidum]|uniref:Uncharacterized protein n=1 Tax=Melastoma candidum TaxID=119954 RepID=A0ACB9P0K7_9MYRT|nr:hypothetical protein MLD38_025450 [Melastoma candidum]
MIFIYDLIKRYRNHLKEAKGCKCGDETASACSQVLTHPEMLNLVQSLPPGPEWGNSGDNVRMGKILDQAQRQATSQKELLMNQEAQQLQGQIGSLDNFAPQQPPFVYFDPLIHQWGMEGNM